MCRTWKERSFDWPRLRWPRRDAHCRVFDIPAAFGAFVLTGWGLTEGLQALGVQIPRVVAVIILIVSIFAALVVAAVY